LRLFRNFVTFFKISAQIVISIFLFKIKILESMVFVISQLKFVWGRDIAQGDGNNLGKFQELKISTKYSLLVHTSMTRINNYYQTKYFVNIIM